MSRMIAIKRIVFWVAAVIAYWACALSLFMVLRPIHWYNDGYGPEAAFYYWGQRAPNTYPQYMYAYWIVASIITLLGCGLTTILLQIWKPRKWQPFLVSAMATFISSTIVVIVSNTGTKYGIWFGPLELMTPRSVLAFLMLMVPMSLLAGVLVFVRERFVR